jgi:hypothetical protein
VNNAGFIDESSLKARPQTFNRVPIRRQPGSDWLDGAAEPCAIAARHPGRIQSVARSRRGRYGGRFPV